MNAIFELINKNSNDQNTCFVFPSETTAAVWARTICLYGTVRSLSPERFLAWDRFKEKTIQAKEINRKPVSAIIRRLFSLALARENAISPFLKEIIPIEYAQSGIVFADSIAAILSSLKHWEELNETAFSGTSKYDNEDRDLQLIKIKYAAFLEENKLFEPSWEKQFFRDIKNHYIIFFPEMLEDFSEYAALFDTKTISIFSASANIYAASKTNQDAENPALLFFESAKDELRSAVLEIRRLYEEGLPYENMAITLPDFKNISPYMERELLLYDIPFNRRAGKSLGAYQAGRLFSLIAECGVSLFSFDALKRLLLNNSIPWKEPEKNSALIEYGVNNHCVAPYITQSRTYSRTIDPWEESFKQNPNEELAGYYGKLKKTIIALCSAKSFRKIRDHYHAFRIFLDMEKCSAESDAVLARCIIELSILIETEEAFPRIAPSSPFDFFVSHLSQKKYVFAQNEGGVNLYDYPVAAGAPYGCHFLLNASQAAAAIQHRPLPFLRQDKRARLGINDSDISAAALSLYNIASWGEYSCNTRISASEKTYAGWAIPHSAFAQNTIKCGSDTEHNTKLTDLYKKERQWWALGEPLPEKLFSIQKKGFSQWFAALQTSKDNTVFQSHIEQLLQERIHRKSNTFTGNTAVKLSVSATDLNDFSFCSLFWLYRRILYLEPYQKEAALLDDQSRGLIYHEILYQLFNRIRKKDIYFKKKNLQAYFGWLEEISSIVLHSNNALFGSLAYPLIAPLIVLMNKRLRLLLETEAEYFDGFEIKELEHRYDIIKGDLRFTGRIDRVSLDLSDSAKAMIIDYKTSYAPPASHCRWDEEKGLRDFQIPMYIKLYEAQSGIMANRAFYVKINEHKIIPVMGEFLGKTYSREQYQSAMDALEKEIERFDSSVSSLDFVPKTIPYMNCISCEFKNICRTLYLLNQ